MKVLILEDEKAMSDLIALKFKVEAFEVKQAANFAEAKQLLLAESFDALLSDFLLPDGDFIDFMNWLRGNPVSKMLPVMVMTNYAEDINADQLKNLGVAEVMIKYQVVPAQMVEKVKQLIISSKTGPANTTTSGATNPPGGGLPGGGLPGTGTDRSQSS